MIGLSYADNKHRYIHKMPFVGPVHNSPGYGETVNCNRDRDNGRSTGNVQTDWKVDRSTFRLAGHVYRSHLIILKGNTLQFPCCSVVTVVISMWRVAVYCGTLI